MKNWKREYFWEETGLAWIPPSPNMPTPETAIIYPGTGLLGALTLNQGLGTPNPFLQFGAPWLDSAFLIQSLNEGKEFGVELEEVKYTPRSLPGKVLHPSYEGRLCRGIRLRIIKKEKFLSLRFTLAFLKTLKKHHPQKIALRARSLNLLFGNDLLSRYLEGKITYKKLLAQIENDEEIFRKKRGAYLLYD
jgi:uncharacterized protein YbbC (DUF1343 family)